MNFSSSTGSMVMRCSSSVSSASRQCRQLKEMENDSMQSAVKLRLLANCTSIALVAPERGDVAQRQRGL